MFFFNFELFLNFELFISFFGTENHENLTESYLKFWQIWKNKIVGSEKGSKFFSEINKKRRLDQNYFKNLRILEIFSKNKNPWKVVRHFKEKVEGGRYDIQGKFFISYCDYSNFTENETRLNFTTFRLPSLIMKKFKKFIEI